MRNPDCPRYDRCLKIAAKVDAEINCENCRNNYPDELVEMRLSILVAERSIIDRKINLLKEYLSVGK